MKLLVLFIACCLVLSTQAQDFSGYRTGNNTGVAGVFYNPASIAGSPFRWDVNLLSASTAIGNNKASFKLSDIGRTLNADSIKNKVFAEGSGPSSGIASVVLQGPSVMFNLDKKSAIAITTRARAMMNIVDIDSKLAKQITDDNPDNVGLPYVVSSATNMVVNANAWTEFGVSYAREMTNSGEHYLKGGATLKYISGAANASINVNNLNGTINYDLLRNDGYLTNARGRVGLNFGGADFSNLEAANLFSFKSTGFGADIGFIYEYRPDATNNSNTSEEANKYKFKVGVALLDVGSMKYNRDLSRSGTYDVHIGNAQAFYLSALADAGSNHFKETLNKYPQFFTEDKSTTAASYNVSLPTTLNVNVDYNAAENVYINAGAQLALTKSNSKIGNSQYYSSFSVTPRFETGAFGVYVPLGYNALTSFTGGLSLKAGPVFIGSGSVLSALVGGSKQADFFIGFRFGSLLKK